MWLINESTDFEKWCKKEKVKNETIEAMKSPLHDFRRQDTKRTKTLYRKNSYEVWDIHIPDKNRHIGKSAGFRVMMRLNCDSNIMILEMIVRRQNLNWRGSQGKHQSKWDKNLKEFKKATNHL